MSVDTGQIACPACGHGVSFVMDSRGDKVQVVVRRRRECAQCKHRFSTYESRFDPRLLLKLRRVNRCIEEYQTDQAKVLDEIDAGINASVGKLDEPASDENARDMIKMDLDTKHTH